MSKRPLFAIDCRSVGPGGTTVEFYATDHGLKAIWTNENCPYVGDGVRADLATNEASDGHNVSIVPWETLASLASMVSERLARSGNRDITLTDRCKKRRR
jgi:hypothetical protein